MGDSTLNESEQLDELVSPKTKIIDLKSIGELFSQITLVTRNSALDEFSVRYDFTCAPGEIVLTKQEFIPQLYQVKEIGDSYEPFLIRNPYQIATFSNVYEYAKCMTEAIFHQLQLAYEIPILPENISYEGAFYTNPDKLGFPYSALYNTIMDTATAQRSIVQLCRPKASTKYTTTVSAMVPAAVSAVRSALIDVGNPLYNATIRDKINNVIATQIRPIIGIPYDMRLPPECTSIEYPTPDAFELNAILPDIPYLVDFSFCCVCYTCAPAIQFTEVNSFSNLAPEIGVNLSNVTNIPSLLTGVVSPDVSMAVHALVSTYVVPGYVELDVDYGLTVREEGNTALFLACFVKLVLHFNPTQGLSSITQSSITKTDRIIADALVNSGSCNYNQIVNYSFPLNCISIKGQQARARFTANDLDTIRTTVAGNGTFDGRNRLRSNTDPLAMIYSTCPKRQIFMRNDYIGEETFDNVNRIISGWDLCQALVKVKNNNKWSYFQ